MLLRLFYFRLNCRSVKLFTEPLCIGCVYKNRMGNPRQKVVPPILLRQAKQVTGSAQIVSHDQLASSGYEVQGGYAVHQREVNGDCQY